MMLHFTLFKIATRCLTEGYINSCFPTRALLIHGAKPKYIHTLTIFTEFILFFSSPFQNSLLHETNPSLWDAFLGRFNDIDKEVRKLCVHMVPQLMKKNPELPVERLLTCFKQRAYDPEEGKRILNFSFDSFVRYEPSDM